MNKKGYFQDYLFWGVMLVVIAIGFIIGGYFITTINDNIQDTDSLTPTAKSISNNFSDRVTKIFDWGFLWIAILFGISIVVTYWILDTNPLLFFPLLIIIAIIIFVLAGVNNLYDDFSNSDKISASASQWTITNYFMDHFLMFVVGFVLLGLIAFFAKYTYT